MGRSKFPGKPSKLVTKKRVSVLSGNTSNAFLNASNELDANESSINQRNRLNATSLNRDTGTKFNTLINDIPTSHQEINNKLKNESKILSPENSLPSDPPDADTMVESEKRTSKKKRVSFKFSLETSDDLHIVKKEPNASLAPTASIIKKECLTRAIRIARESIIQPSRLTGLNNVDKLNSLTFKLQRSNCTNQMRINSEDSGDDEPNDHIERQMKQGYDSENSDNEKNSSNNHTDDDENASFTIEESENATDNKTKSRDANINNQNEKKFILPKRSAHSSRVIKPNKKFIDESQTSMIRKNSNVKKKCTKIETVGNGRTDNEKIDSKETQESDGGSLKLSEHVKNNPFAKIIDNNPFELSSKSLLRKSRLQFAAPVPSSKSGITNNSNSAGHDCLFAVSNLAGTSLSRPTLSLSSAICPICSSVSPPAFSHQSKKYGIHSCDSCRKFIKKVALNNGENSLLNGGIECKTEDGQCPIIATARSARSYKAASKERCLACWLKKCVFAYRLPSELRQKIISVLPINMRAINLTNQFVSNSFGLKIETTDSNTSNKSNIFANSLNSNRRMLSWPKESNSENEFRSFGTITNPLAENNVKFGSSPQIVPTISEKPVIMTPSSATSVSNNDICKEVNAESETKDDKISVGSLSTPVISLMPQLTADTEEITRLRLRKKERDTVTTSIAVSTVTVTTANTIEATKRQRIDLKGPRVKHVCRSASIVLGQPIATFADGSPILESFDTPPRPESPNGIVEFVPSSISLNQNDKPIAQFTELSPPATPIINEYDSSESIKDVGKISDKILNENIRENKKLDDSKPITRKLTRPATNSLLNGVNSANFKKLNAFISIPEAPKIKPPSLISIDFWENYDPAEVSQTGFGLILSESVPLKVLCFLCGSHGQDPLIFCVCCCEPYHQYCVEDEYNLKCALSDDLNASDTSTNDNLPNSKLNWLCPRCTVCYTCNMATGTKVKCQKCQKNYHSTCLGTSKRLLGADRPLICANCLKCKSCGTTNVSKFVGNLPMCSVCFKLRQKGNYCPLCQKCYEDNDFNIKMMECGHCHYWVHSKCEGLSDEQYNLLSVLPENIEFICKKCSKIDSSFDAWRQAVQAEFKSGLLSVVKLLSKSRQACALLKLSPRKKPSLTCRACITRQNEFLDESKNDISIDEKETCICVSKKNINQNSNTTQSLLDIKQKILENKYFSLADFNYDMNIVINAASCDDLMLTYKEILSEAFPWFQNETKACTDALEEDMYDSSNFDGDSPNENESDQQVPIINIPCDIEEFFYKPIDNESDNRSCSFCKSIGDGISSNESRLLYCGQNSWAHINCAMWSAEVFEEIDGSLQNVHSAISRGRLIKCSLCGNKGATVGCNVKSCGEHYHFPCARASNCTFMKNKTFYCPQHIDKAVSDEKNNLIEANFEVNRPVYVELDRKRRRPVNPKCVQFLIGSLHVKQLGRFIPKLSDRYNAIIPVDFLCSRLYWSTKEPWKIVEYSIRTTIQHSSTATVDMGRNFTVDHSSAAGKIQMDLAQIDKWHSSLQNDDEDIIVKSERMAKVSTNGDEANDEEPQSNADLLPPEIKDAIFEDLPHDILDGISMLDILSNLEDVGGIDSKSESYFNSDFLREANIDDDLSQNSQTIDNWISTNNHVEDVMLSARSAASFLKRGKADVLNRSSSSQRSWSKLDPSSSKRRKIPVRLPENVLISIRRKEETNYNIPVSDELKNKTFTWSAAKRFSPFAITDANQSNVDILAKRSFKISQLDGMDDIILNDKNLFDSNKAPVKCERCHCSYRSRESYRKHLQTCESLSTSESESESKSPEIQSQQIQSNMVFTSINSQDYCNIPLVQTNTATAALAQQTLFGLNGSNINQIATMPITSLQNATQLPVQMQGIFINPQTQQQQMFAQPALTLAGNSVFPFQNNQATTSTAQTVSLQQATSQNIQYQPQIISCTTANSSQVLSGATSQHPNISTTNFTAIKTIQTQQSQPAFNKNQMILPQMDKNQQKKSPSIKLPPASNRSKNMLNPKNIQLKKSNLIKTETTKSLTQITNQNIRPSSDNGNIVIQSAANNQTQHPLIVHQLAQPNVATNGNVLQYIQGADGQLYAVPSATGDFKTQTTSTNPYLTSNSLIPGAFHLQTTPDNMGSNLLLTNTPNGLQVIQNGAIQLAQPHQQQVFGTLVQPHTTTIQCGMMSSEQMMLGATPTFEMVTNPLNGCVLLNSQPVYYGLETIVQNTVMQSQQFVSTAMQGVLSQNSSFSATTTQVFQASKIEPIMEMQPSYVVLNNDGTIIQPQSTQQPMLSTNILQQALPQLQPTQNTQNPTWRFFDDKSAILQTSHNITQPQVPVHVTASQASTSIQSFQTTQPLTTQPITTQPAIAHTKIAQPKQILKHRSTKQLLVQKQTTNKPIIKSSPILVNTEINENDLNIAHPPRIPNETFVLSSPAVTKNNTNISIETKSSSKLFNVASIKQTKATKPISNVAKLSPANIKPKNIKKISIDRTKQILKNSIQSPAPSITITSLPPISVKTETPKSTSSTIYQKNGNNVTLINFDSNADVELDKESNLTSKNILYNTSQSILTSSTDNKPSQITSSVTNSIQLPTAPYANGIPTNVVNPIQQYNTNRPTNRVLPMQNVQLKISTTLSENNVQNKTEKSLIIDKKKSEILVNKENDHIKIDNRISGIESMEIDVQDVKEDEIKTELALDDNSNHTDSDSSESVFKEAFFTTYSAEDAFDKLKNQDNPSTVVIKKDPIDITNENIIKQDTDNNDINNIECVNMFALNDTVLNHSNSKSPSFSDTNEQKENLKPIMHQHQAKIQNTFKGIRSDISKSHGPKLLYEIQSQDGFTYKSTSITDVWEKVFEAVQIARKAHGLSPLPVGPLADMCGYQMLGLKTNALKYLLEQLPGVERCTNYKSTYHNRAESTISQTSSSGYWSDYDEFKENTYGTARCERYKGRSEYDMFSWLASRHRKQPIQIYVPQNTENDAIPRRGSGSNLPMAMRYRTLKDTYKDSVGVYRSHIHGRGLFCTRDIEAGEMVIEYAGELIRSTLTDKRERYYDGRGIGCYMFKIDENLVVDATMRGNAARFINHSCEPNCYSKVVDILGHKHIIIFALRRIVQGEELTYDYKFPFEETKIPCTCGSRKCRKYLN